MGQMAHNYKMLVKVLGYHDYKRVRLGIRFRG